MIFARVLLTYVFDILCTGLLCSLSVVGMAIFHVLNLFLQSHGHKWTVYRTGRIGVLCIWYVRLDFQFQYNGNAIILMFDHAECRIDKWHITMASHTRPGISTHWQLYCLLNSLLRQTWKKKHQAELLWGESTGGGIAAHWTTKVQLQWPLATGIHWWPVVSPHTGTVMSSITKLQVT